MAEIVYRAFSGEQPRLEAHLLPDSAAQLALNCEFESGALVPTRAGAELTTLQSNPIRGLHTIDGVNFMSWPVEAHTFPSPVLEDNFNRMYFLLPSEGEVRAGLMLEATPAGPTPAATCKVGVPQPTVAPVLTLIDRDTLPEYPNANVTLTTWWEHGGKNYGETAALVNPVRPYREYTFATPTLGDAPSSATLVAKLLIKDVANQILVSLSVRAGSSGRSNGLPGGVEATLANEGAQGRFVLTWGVTETRAYTYTNENSWNEEGAPAPPSTISPTYLQDVQVVVAPTDFTGYRPFLRYGIYRTYGANTTYIKTDVSGAAPTLIDASRLPASIGGALESMDWFVPPGGLGGMVMAAGGWFAAYKGSNLHLSEPYYPHAWPYVHRFPSAIRGVMPTQQALVVTTADGVYLLTGANPIGTQQLPLNLPQPGVSQRSMVSIDGAIAYASQDGFPMVSGSSATMLACQNLFTRKVWRERYGAILTDNSMRFSYHDGSLIMSSSSQADGFALRLDEDIGAFARSNVRMDCTFLLPVNDALYYSVGNKLYAYRQGATQDFDWWSKDFVYRKPRSFGAGFIRCAGPITLSLYSDGVLVHEALVSSGYFGVPDINPALRWSVRLRGAAKVEELQLGLTFMDLENA